jgi:WD40 repeat protein
MRPVTGRPLFVGVSPDGRYLLIANNEGKNDLVDAATGKVLRDVGPGYVAFSTDGSIVHLLFDPLRLEVTSIDSASVKRSISFPTGTKGGSFAPDLSTISSVDPDRRGVSILDPTSGAIVRHLATPADSTALDVWQYAGGNVLTVDHQGLLTPVTDRDEISAAYGQPVLLRWWPSGAEAPTAAITAFADDGIWTVDVASRTIAVAEDSGNVGIYDLGTGQRREMRVRHNGLQGLSFSPDGHTLVTAGDDHLLQVWDMTTGELRETLAGHNGKIHAPALSDVGGHLTAWSVGLDGQLIEWDLSGDRRLGRPFAAGGAADFEGGSAAGVAVSPDGRLLATTDLEGRVRIMDGTTLTEVRRIDAVPGGQALALAFSPDGRTLAVAGQGGAVASRWDVVTGAAVGGPLPGPPAMLPRDPEAPLDVPDAQFQDASRTIAFSPDGRWLAAGVEDGRIYIWDAATGAAAGDPISAGGPIFSVAFTPDSTSIAASYFQTAPEGSFVRIWSVADHKTAYEVSLGFDQARPYAVAFSPDGKLVVTGGGEGIVRFWDAATGAAAGRSILASAGWVHSLAFDPSGTILVSAGSDGTARLLDSLGRQQLGSVLPGEDSDARAAVSPDGKRLYVVYGTGHAFAWDISPAALAAHACTVAGRTLTTDEWERYLPGRPYQPACAGAS